MHNFAIFVVFTALTASAFGQSKPASSPASKPASAPAKAKADGPPVVEVKDNRASVAIPGHPVIVTFWADQFKPEENTQFGGRSLAYGGILKEAVINVFYEHNFPYLSSLNYREQWQKKPNYQAFMVNSTACCEYTNDAKGAFIQSFYDAHIVTNAFALNVHVSVARIEIKGKPSGPKFTREDFIKIVKSVEIEGEADLSKLKYPKEVYDFRDAASKHEADQLNWVAKECARDADAYAGHFYYGLFAMKRKLPDFASTGFSKAAELLAKKENRTPAEERAFLDALTGGQTALVATKHYREAVNLYQKLLDTIKAESGDEFKKARDESIYGLAVCYVQIAQPERGIETLKNAVAANPLLKRRAKEDPLLAPIRNHREFGKIVE